MQYIELHFSDFDCSSELIMAHLYTYDFTGFEEVGQGQLIAYLAVTNYTSALQEELSILKQKYALQIVKKEIQDQNWNAEWEKDYQPVCVDQFCRIRAEFHKPSSRFEHEILITPQMSFGTGHHATTYMMIKQMNQTIWTDQNVLDYGCGTGVLAILAVKLGAKHADAIDIDYWAYENTKVNSIKNATETKIKVGHGDLSQITSSTYSRILANINRNTILESLDELSKRLLPEGELFCSGFLIEEQDMIREKAKQYGLSFQRSMQREQWASMVFQKDL
ncbi:MAG: 50S ribosomal protein L11 methyltransferase [Saprospiraceae bacterium]|nr:50S ribosomal protein L11 methyltransferase [Saprospiraceae bacterium]